MPDAYLVSDGRYIGEDVRVSAAGATSLDSTPCPENYVRTILTAGYQCSAVETKTLYWAIVRPSGNVFPITIPIAQAMNANLFPLVEQGMEVKMFPGEILRIYRDSATAGSTMAMYIRFIESPLPIYQQYEPQKDVLAQKFRRGSITRVLRSVAGGSYGGSPPPGAGGREGAGGGGRGLPK